MDRRPAGPTTRGRPLSRNWAVRDVIRGSAPSAVAEHKIKREADMAITKNLTGSRRRERQPSASVRTPCR